MNKTIALQIKQYTNYKPFPVLKYVFLSIKFIENHQEKYLPGFVDGTKDRMSQALSKKMLNKWIKTTTFPFLLV